MRCPACLETTFACDACAEATAQSAWERYCESGHKPVYVPARPDLVYADAWRGWRDWVRWTIAEPRLRVGFEIAVLAGASPASPAGS